MRVSNIRVDWGWICPTAMDSKFSHLYWSNVNTCINKKKMTKHNDENENEREAASATFTFSYRANFKNLYAEQ